MALPKEVLLRRVLVYSQDAKGKLDQFAAMLADCEQTDDVVAVQATLTAASAALQATADSATPAA